MGYQRRYCSRQNFKEITKKIFDSCSNCLDKSLFGRGFVRMLKYIGTLQAWQIWRASFVADLYCSKKIRPAGFYIMFRKWYCPVTFLNDAQHMQGILETTAWKINTRRTLPRLLNIRRLVFVHDISLLNVTIVINKLHCAHTYMIWSPADYWVQSITCAWFEHAHAIRMWPGFDTIVPCYMFNWTRN